MRSRPTERSPTSRDCWLVARHVVRQVRPGERRGRRGGGGGHVGRRRSWPRGSESEGHRRRDGGRATGRCQPRKREVRRGRATRRVRGVPGSDSPGRRSNGGQVRPRHRTRSGVEKGRSHEPGGSFRGKLRLRVGSLISTPNSSRASSRMSRSRARQRLISLLDNPREDSEIRPRSRGPSARDKGSRPPRCPKRTSRSHSASESSSPRRCAGSRRSWSSSSASVAASS
jgi:hypothetical protein